jgi:hypothetical protein
MAGKALCQTAQKRSIPKMLSGMLECRRRVLIAPQL